MEETKTTIKEIIFNYVRGYIKHLFMSLSLFYLLFLTLVSLVFIIYTIILSINFFVPGFYNSYMNNFFVTFISSALNNFFKNGLEQGLYKAAGFVLIFLPLIYFLLNFIFKLNSEKIEHKFVIRYFIIITIIFIISGFINVILFWNVDTLANLIGVLIAFSIGPCIMSGIGFGLYILSEIVENAKLIDGKIKYENDWKE